MRRVSIGLAFQIHAPQRGSPRSRNFHQLHFRPTQAASSLSRTYVDTEIIKKSVSLYEQRGPLSYKSKSTPSIAWIPGKLLSIASVYNRKDEPVILCFLREVEDPTGLYTLRLWIV